MIEKLNCSRRCLFKLFSELADSSSLLVLVDHFAWWASIAQVIAMEKWNKMKEELELINKKSFKGKSTIESATVLSDIDTTNKRDDMFAVIKELYNLSKNVLKLAKPSKQDTSNIEEVIKKQLADVLPGLLKTALSSVPALQNKEDTSVKEVTAPSERHTVTLTKKSDTEENSPSPITDREWTEVVRSDLKGSLKAVPVKKATFLNGAATLDFTSKVHMEEAQKTLSAKYEVSSKSEDRKKLDPKLTIFNIDPDVADGDQLLEELLEKNQSIRTLNVNKQMKVVFYNKSERYAVIQVSPAIRESIRQNGDYVHLDLGSHQVKDRIHVIQCYHCQEFGHMAGKVYCKSKDKDPVCFYCAGNHSSKDCKSRKERKVNKIRCHNCAKSRNSTDKAAANTHKASDTLCPFYIRERVRVMSRTAGCEQAKNVYLQKIREQKLQLGRV